jgi:hypothetical protein
MQVENYIVRIYRRGRNKVLVGVVEAAASGWQKPFRNVSELMYILVAPKRRSGHSTQETAELPKEERKANTLSVNNGSDD